jgi:hypothetical protein
MAVSQPISGTGAPLVDPSGDPLAALRDIHLPAPIETWPPAIGWWLLAVIGVIACIAIIYALWRYWRANQYRREAMAQLRQLREQHAGASSDYLYHYTTLLKRVALTHYPRAKVAALTGEAWVAFLDETCGSREFSMGAGQVLIQGQYQAPALLDEKLDEEIDIDALHKLGEHWIKRHHNLPVERSASSKQEGERAGAQEVSLT